MARLPPEPTRLIGRERELERVAELLRQARLVTLTGSPGVGKSRVALRAARNHGGRAYFAELTAARDLAGLCEAVARAIAMPDAPGEERSPSPPEARGDPTTPRGSFPPTSQRLPLGGDPVASLGARLERLGGALLVLDGGEALAALLASTAGAWLATAPELRLLVTSRERLRLREEVALELGPLADEGAELFVERARAALPDWTPDARERELVARVVGALDGVPLALELAAARLGALGLERLLDRLSQSLELLSRGPQGAGRKQATLRGAIDWSWQLLDDRLCRALASAAVFRGGFAVEAAEAVLGAGALELCEDLRDRSLLRLVETGRFALYQSIRQFAGERLDGLGARAEVEARHRDHYLELGERLCEAIERDGAPLEPLARERDNLIAVVERSFAAGRGEEGARALLALGPVLSAHGPARFHLELCDRALEHEVGHPKLLWARARARQALGDLEGAERDLHAAADACPEPRLHAVVRKDLGVLHHQKRAIDPARVCYEAALPAMRELGDSRGEAIVVGNLGALEHDIGRFELAHQRYDQALAALRRLGDARLEGIYLTNLGVLEHEEGRSDAARRRFQRALELLSAAGDLRFEAIALGNLGQLEHEAGAFEAALGLHERALALLAQVGDLYSEALCRARIGAVLASFGRSDEAERALASAERLAQGRMAGGLVSLLRAFVDVQNGDVQQAFARMQAAQESSAAEPSLAEVNDDARLTLRLLSKRLANSERPRLEIGPGASWFRLPGGERQSLEKHAAARRLLDKLASERAAAAGRPIGAEELFEAGWPGVRIAAESASNRLYVTLAKLRKLGLKTLLLRSDDGYLLDPETPLLRVAE